MKIINNRIKIIILLTTILMLILIINLFKIQIIDNKYYLEDVDKKSTIITYGDSTPRGRIYDRNGVLLVDNEVVKTIYYIKNNNDTYLDEINKSYEIANEFEINYDNLDIKDLKKFYYLKNNKLNNKISNEEIQKYKNRELSSEDIYNLKIERITNEELNIFNEIDKEAAYIYYLMNKGYSYSKKVIKENVNDLEFAKAGELINKIKGLDVKLDWKRKYIYNDTLKNIFGEISNCIPYELKDYYLDKGYSLND